MWGAGHPTATPGRESGATAVDAFAPGAAIARKGETNWSCITTPVRDRATGAPALIASAHALVGLRGGEAAEVWVPDESRKAGIVIGSVARILRRAAGDAVLIRPKGKLARLVRRAGGGPVTHAALPVIGSCLALAGRFGRSSAGCVTDLGLFTVRHGGTPVTFEGVRLEPVRGRTGYRLCGPGDSGGLWYDATTGAAVGIHVAGGRCAQSGRPYALACRIGPVLDAFSVEIPA
jgi:hypothetical protein